MMDTAEKISNPTKFYRHPNEVRDDDTLTKEEKITLLLNWQDDEKLKSIATEENMLPPFPNEKSYMACIEKLLEYYQSN
ncbi:MAG: hypothetical protein Q8M03_08085 [Legionella sp.]|nr:hypothetical protein [Legionella sp.]